MDDSQDRLLNTSTRKLLRNMREVVAPQDTPTPFRNQAAAKGGPPKGALNRSKRSRRSSRSSRGGEDLRSEVLHRQAEQSSFMDQTFNVSVIQGVNQTYANIAAPDSGDSSVNSSIDLEKGARFRKQKTGKLKTAPLPAEIVMTKPPVKKKKRVVESSETSEKVVPMQSTTAQGAQAVEAQNEPTGSSTTAGTAKKMRPMPPEAASPREAESSFHTSANLDVSSISTLSRRSDATYDFSVNYDETLPNILETKRFRNQAGTRKLNLPSLIDALQAKQKSADSVTVSDILDTLNVPEVQASSPDKASQEPLETSNEESSELHSPSLVGSDDAIPPPMSFRDNEANRSAILRESYVLDVDNTSRIKLHLEESTNPLPKTPAPPEEDLVVDLQTSASAAQTKSLSRIDTSPIKTPTRPLSLGPITDAMSISIVSQISGTATTQPSPTHSVPRKSLESEGQVIDTSTTKIPVRSSPRRSMSQASASKSLEGVGQVTDATTTPIRSPRKSMGLASASKPSTSVGQVTDATTTPTRSPRRSIGQASASKSSPRRSAGQPSASKSPRRSAGQASATKLSPRRSTGQVSATKSSPRRSMGQASATKSSPRRSMGQASATKLSPRRSMSQASATKLSPRRSMGQASATKSSPRRSMGQASATKSSPRRSMGQASASESSARVSVGKVTDITTTKTPSRSSLSGSVGQVTDVTPTNTPTLSLPRQSLKRNLSSVLLSPQKSNVVDNTITGESLGQSKNAQARHRDTTPIISEASPAEEGNESEEEKRPKKRKTSQPLLEEAEKSSFSDIENEFSLLPIRVRTPPAGYMQDIPTREEESDSSIETSPFSREASPAQETPMKEQPSAPSTTKVRQMTMKEFLEQLKKKPMPPPVSKPTPSMPSLFGTAVPSTSQAKPQGKPRRKRKRKKPLPASVPKRLTKEVFTHFTKCRVTKAAMDEVYRIAEIFWDNLIDDVSAFQISKKHPTKSIQPEDVEKLMKRQGLITSKESLDVLVEQLLPMEMWRHFKTFPEPARNPFPTFTGSFFDKENFANLNKDDSTKEN